VTITPAQLPAIDVKSLHAGQNEPYLSQPPYPGAAEARTLRASGILQTKTALAPERRRKR
jgi:hypothetical protein